ncbi:MAG: histidine phosphatase family protein [Salinivirgaceae bacterium]
MKTLMLMRHAKSSWKEPLPEDRERPILNKGIKRTRRTARFITEKGLIPELILSSPAVRAWQTADLLLEELGTNIKIKQVDALYPGSSAALLKATWQVNDKYNSLLIIGHNPGLSDLACYLLGTQEASWIPTSGLVVISFLYDRWQEIKPGEGSMLHYIQPKALPD